MRLEIANINLGINKSSKLSLHNIRSENINLDMSMYLRDVMTRGKRRKYKLGSGTHALGNELKRWSSRNNNGNCKCCDSNSLVDVMHFVAQCPKFLENRKIFLIICSNFSLLTTLRITFFPKLFS